MKRILALLLALAMLLSLCACSEPEEALPESITSSGRYVETGITPEQFQTLDADYGTLYGMEVREDGSIDLLVWACTFTDPEHTQAEGRYIWYHSEDRGDSWEEVAVLEESPHVLDWNLSRDGQVCAAEYDSTENGTPTGHLLFRDETGAERTLYLPSLENADGADCTYYDRNTPIVVRTYIMQGETPVFTLYGADPVTGETLWEYLVPGEESVSYQLAGEELYVDITGSKEVILDVETGKTLSNFDFEKDFNNIGALWYLQINSNGTYFYYGDDGRLCRGIIGDEIEEVILEPSEYRYGSLYMGAMEFVVTEESTIYLNVEQQGSNFLTLFRYDFDQNATGFEDALTIWTTQDYPTLRQAALKFKELHPEIKVEMEDVTFSNSEFNDELTILNTQLLAGEGPDILILDQLDYENYMEKGLLADLSQLYEANDFEGSTVSALLDEDGKCYVIPARFAMTLLLGNDLEAPESVSALVQSLTAKGEEEKPLMIAGFYSFSDLLWRVSAPEIVTADAINEENLRLYLESVKAVSDHAQSFRTYSEDEPMEEGMAVASVSVIYDYGNQNCDADTGTCVWRDNEAELGWEIFGDIDSMVGALTESQMEGLTMRTDSGHFSVTQFPGLTEGAYTPSVLMAVSAASKHQELAKEFLACTLGMEVQQYTYGDGLPVLKEAMDAQMDYFRPYAAEVGWDISQLQTLMDSRTTPVTYDEEVWNVIELGAEEYCRGERSLDETVEEIKTSLALRLAEQ